jgi:hypothetical protein
MIRGTNAQFKFKLPYNYSDLSIVKVTFWQPGNSGPATDRPLPIVKILSQCSPSKDTHELSVTLSQEETLRFSDKTKAYVQLRASSIDGNAFASKQEQITVYPLYDDSVLEEGILPTPSDDGWIILDGNTIK